ncbi:hypothetical protein ALC57_05347 [Trachymyrmex cornetzi]|uniref:CCHC-type domain-containing protein n=1 Tax=Trachymyrmex cornetzi TaxID=471704 RepID=A0A151JAU9_9HYME|nr:hypothetical protein ALC57_05347 [Trachymyrmex cornetzi]
MKFRGQCLPRSVTYLHVSFPVLPYFPRVLMCFSCLRYGHVSSDCKSKPRCARCGSQKHPIAEDCRRLQLPPICCNCGGQHLPSSSGCPTYMRHKQIYAYATIENLSYSDARQKFGTSSPIVSLPPLNFFHHSDFPPLSNSTHSPHPSRVTPSYDDLLVSGTLDNSSAPLDSRYYSGRSYADMASTASPNKQKQMDPHRPRDTTLLRPPPGSFPRAHPRTNNSNDRTFVHRPPEYIAYSKLRESHNALLYSPNGRPPSYTNSPAPSSFLPLPPLPLLLPPLSPPPPPLPFPLPFPTHHPIISFSFLFFSSPSPLPPRPLSLLIHSNTVSHI